MSTDLHSDNSGGTTTTSPRISFSYNLPQSDTVPAEQHLLRSHSSPTIDFNFCIIGNSDLHHASTADELFSDGKLLPKPIKPKTETCKTTPLPSRPENAELKLKQRNSKSIWGFKRSSSCGNGYGGSLCPIVVLSRSNSMGNSIITKQSSPSGSKEGFNQKYYQRNVQKKAPLMKNGYGYGNHAGIRVNPVLNLGFGSFFSSKSNNKNKR